jgi:proteasome lid subunit RPN8/RPN11
MKGPYKISYNARRRLHDRAHRAQQKGDLEVCGVLVVEKQQNLDLVFAKNHSSRSCRFEIDLDEVRDIRRDMKARGMTVVGSFHSHPVGLWMPGPGDCESAALNFLMLVYDVTGRQLASWRIVKAGERKTSVVVRSP